MKKIEETAPYFGEREELAVLEYINSDSQARKNEIYNEILIEPFRIMTQSILRKYPVFIGNYTMLEVETNALIHLIDKMILFNPDNITSSGNKSKAYSYCQTIIRNYYRDHGKKSYHEVKTNLPYEDYATEINERPEYISEMHNDSENQLELLINNIIDSIEKKITAENIKRNELIVGYAIINILKNWEILFQEDSEYGKYSKKVTNKFAKTKILFYLKEQTGLSTKEIRVATKPFKDMYFIKKMEFFSK